jgi:polysaccharide biosynthesis/export protein
MILRHLFRIEKKVNKLTSICVAFLVLSCLPVSAQNVSPKVNPTDGKSQSVSDPAKKTAAESEQFIIGIEDVLSINVYGNQEVSIGEVVVRPDGKISLPLIDEVQANGLTTMQLQEEITVKLGELFVSPNVTVTVVRIQSKKVSIVGEVRNPGEYPLGAPITMLELLARAGGFSEYANTKKIRIIRKEGQNTKQFMFNYKEVAGGKNLQQNIVLKNGDIIIVP